MNKCLALLHASAGTLLTPFGIEDSKTCQSTEPLNVNQIEKCIEWLSKKKLRKTFNYFRDSYDYKHDVEDEMNTYIANGSFIAAVIHMGIPYKKLPESLNVLVPISKERRKIKAKKIPFNYKELFEI